MSLLVQILWQWCDGKKSYLAAWGLAGLALYRLTQQDYDGALQAGTQALAVLGLRHAIGKTATDSPVSLNKE